MSRFSLRTLALALGMASGFLTKAAETKKRVPKPDKYPDGFNRAREEARRRRQLAEGALGGGPRRPL